MIDNPPIIYFAFNRPYHTKQSLQSLIKNKNTKQYRLYAFIDGPRNIEERLITQKVAQIIKSFTSHFKSLIININSENKGCDTQIISNLISFSKQFSEFIYLEDDIVVNPYFLNYITQALNKYRDCPEVKTIAGYLPSLEITFSTPFFLKTFSTWGFGCYSRAIDAFNHDAQDIIYQLNNKKLMSVFTYEHSSYSLDLLKRHIKDANNIAWDVKFNASILLSDGYTLFPNSSLANNIGTDSSGSNFSFSTNKYDVDFHLPPSTCFPDTIKASQNAYNAMVKFHKSHKLTFLGHIKSKTTKIVNLILKKKS